MQSLPVLGGVCLIGYVIDQISRKNEFEKNNENTEIPIQNINGCEEQYPWDFIEPFENTNDPSPLTPVSIKSPCQIEGPDYKEPDYPININKRQISDFKHNNMVPFFRGTGTGQSMRGTGILEGNTNFDNYNTGSDHLTPNYNTLSTFTGCDNTYLHKREVPTMYSPMERVTDNTIPGKNPEAQKPNLDIYKTSILYKNEQTPFEPIKVGPGIAIDVSEPNDGQGFNSGISTQIKPNNVNSYRLHQFSGRVCGTKAQFGELPTALPGTGPSLASYQNSLTNDRKNNAVDKNDNIDTSALIKKNGLYGVPQKTNSLITQICNRPLVATPCTTQAPTERPPTMSPGTHKKNTGFSFGDSVQVT